MALPRYQNIGVQAGGSIDNLPRIDFPNRGEATRGFDTISNALDMMSGAFFKEAQIAATEEGRVYGAENAPSQEQIKLAVETGTPIEPIGDARTYFGRAAREVSTRIAAIGVEAQAQQDLKRIKEGISTGAIGPSGVMPQVNSLIQGYSTALGQFDPVMGRKLQAELAKDGNTLFLAATARAAAAAAAAAKKSITDVADAKLDNIKYVLEAGDRVITDSDPTGAQQAVTMPVKEVLRIEEAKLENVITCLKTNEQERYREAWSKEVVKGVDLQVSNAILNGDVEGVKRQLVSGEYRDLLKSKPEARYTLINRIESYENQVAREQQAQLRVEAGRYTDQLENAVAALKDGRTDVDLSFFSREKTAKLLGERADSVNMQVESALRINSEVSKLMFATPAEQQATVQRMTAALDPNSKEYTTRRAELVSIQNMISTNQAALTKDPALYVNKAPSVQQSYRTMQEALADPNSSPDQRRIAIDNYARASLDMQTYLGVPAPNRAILPQQAVDTLALEITGRMNSGENVAGIIQSQANYWGPDYWPVIEKQLIDNKFPREVSVVSNMLNFGQRNAAFELASALQTDEKKKVDSYISTVPDANRDIKDQTASKLTEFQRSLQFRVGGPEQFNAYSTSVETLAKRYIFNTGSSAKDAVERAYKDIIGNAYQFTTTSREAIRIPNLVNGRPNDITPDVVSFGINTARNTLEKYPLAQPKSISGLKPDEIMRQYVSSLKSFGRFVTNSDETGVNIIDADGYAVKVVDPESKAERVLNLSWNELKLLSSQELEARAQQAAQRRRQETTQPSIAPSFRLPTNR